MARIVVVGGSLGGLRVTEGLYAAGWDGEVVVLSAEEHAPYTRPPLSKAALTAAPDLATLAFKQRPEAGRAEWRYGVSAVSCDLDARTLRLSDGTDLSWDGLVAATGVEARRLPEVVGTGGHVVRTYDDCRALQERLTTGTRLVVLGAGFIGSEIAATAVRLGCEVDVVALDDVPMQAPLGREVGAAIQRRHEREGVRFHLGRGIASFTCGTDATRVTLEDGTKVEGDVLVQAIGSAPATSWLAGNDLDLTDGLVCDNDLRIEGRRGVVAVGDVARFPNPLIDDVPRRVEHWQMPMDTARRAAATLLSDLTAAVVDTAPFAPLPSFWSDQYDLRVQSFGSLAVADRAEVLEGDLDDEAVVGYFRGDDLVGALLLGMPRQMVRVRKMVVAALAQRQECPRDRDAPAAGGAA
ncbi:NADPH-dependent 2,4-dienoyl-CoA reductase/sulfur reductase-like enzyme [Nocardioides cavernae]|uniref:NADPH-dependent 2,4-dienoyl-CoA reductase/sulfur reductase-like enzyme n=1 Tax=Nocardioides cavernae TaxID=1921566 RepID=A0A7Y9H0P5_9ACTN|nr:FAD-dependent oxidoreductase [Nocardioides cavernae]NYE35825.1 NADPH-dependent 2,4-dienoyl-CoA reductase/sulfur reductase-like enzyme [Nocardioides cavernae]